MQNPEAPHLRNLHRIEDEKYSLCCTIRYLTPYQTPCYNGGGKRGSGGKGRGDDGGCGEMGEGYFWTK